MLFWVSLRRRERERRLTLCLEVYDVSNRETFDALNTWWNEVNTYCSSPNVVKMIVGNKVDKVSHTQTAFFFIMLLTMLILGISPCCEL